MVDTLYHHHQKVSTKGQLISKANRQAVNSSKKRTNEFVFTTMRRVFVRFSEEIEDTQKTFRNYLTFISVNFQRVFSNNFQLGWVGIDYTPHILPGM